MGLDTLLSGATSIISANKAQAGVEAGLRETREGRDQSIEAQRAQTQKAIEFLTQQAGLAREELAPFREAQLGALAQLQGLTQPGSEFETQQREAATQNIQRQLSAQGLLRSKNQSDLLSNLELGLSQQRQNILSGLLGTGAAQGTAANLTGLGQQVGGLQAGLGQQIGGAFQSAAGPLAQFQVGLGQARGAGLRGVNAAVQEKIGQIQQLALLGATGGLSGLGGAAAGAGGAAGAAGAGAGAGAGLGAGAGFGGAAGGGLGAGGLFGLSAANVGTPSTGRRGPARFL